MSSAEYHKRQEILKYRHELNVMLGGDVAQELGLDKAEPADRETVMEMSRLLNRTLCDRVQGRGRGDPSTTEH